MKKLLLQVTLLACYLSPLSLLAQIDNEIPITISEKKEAYDLLMKARDYIWVDNRPQARKLLIEALKIDSTYATAYLYRSFTAFGTDSWIMDLDNASRHLDKFNSAEQLMYNIEMAIKISDKDMQLQLCKELQSQYPQSVLANCYVGWAHSSRNEIKEEREAYEKAIAVNPNHFLGYAALGLSCLYDNPKDYPKAEKNFKRVTELKGNLPGPYGYLGDLYRIINDLPRAQQAYAQSLTIDPSDALSYLKRGHINAFLGRYEQAVIDYKKAEQLYPSYKWEVINYMNYLKLYAGNWQEAKASFQALADSCPSTQVGNIRKFGYLQACANIAWYANQAEEVDRYLKEMWPLNLKNGERFGTDEANRGHKAWMLVWDAFALSLKGNFNDAKAKAEEAKQLLEPIKNPTKLNEYYNALADIEFRQGNYTDAIKYWNLSYPNNVFVKYRIAQCHEKMGDQKAAGELYKEVANWNISNMGYAQIRKDVRDKLGLK